MAGRLLLSDRGSLIVGRLAAAADLVVEDAVALEDACTRYPEAGGAPRAAARAALDEVRRSIHTAFALPADPRDLLRAVAALDALATAIASAAGLLDVARPAVLPEAVRAQAATLVGASTRIADAWQRVRARRDATAEVADVRALEREGDVLRRGAIAALFGSGLEPMEILRLQAIHEALEDAIDRARGCGDAVGALALTLRG